jgi:hypothetical protein
MTAIVILAWISSMLVSETARDRIVTCGSVTAFAISFCKVMLSVPPSSAPPPGKRLATVLTDAKAAEIGRAAVPLLYANDFDRGVTSIVVQVAQVITDDANVGLNPAPGKTLSPTEP